MKRENEIREELRWLYKGREWREKNRHLTDMGGFLHGKFYSPKMIMIEFERAEERIKTLEWVLEEREEGGIVE